MTAQRPRLSLAMTCWFEVTIAPYSKKANSICWTLWDWRRDWASTVTDLISGGNDLLELKRPDGRTLLVPFVEAIVPEVHLDQGWLLLTPPPGLLEL